MNQPKLSLILHQLCCPVSRASLTVRFTVKSGDPPGAGKIWENRFCPKKKWTNRIKKTAKSRRTHAKEPWELVRLCFRSLFWTNESPCDLSYAIIQLKLSVLSLVQTTVGFGNLVSFSTFWGKLIDDLQKSDCYGLNSERKQSLTSSHGSLACVLLLLAVFWILLVHFFSAKSILPYFSSPRGVATSVPFPEVRSRKGTESGLVVGRNATVWV